MSNVTLLESVKSASDEIGASGRILLRPSGTENLIRLMAEHKNPDKCKQYVDKLTKIIEDIGKEL